MTAASHTDFVVPVVSAAVVAAGAPVAGKPAGAASTAGLEPVGASAEPRSASVPFVVGSAADGTTVAETAVFGTAALEASAGTTDMPAAAAPALFESCYGASALVAVGTPAAGAQEPKVPAVEPAAAIATDPT